MMRLLSDRQPKACDANKDAGPSEWKKTAHHLADGYLVKLHGLHSRSFANPSALQTLLAVTPMYLKQ
jgi:hypothetical protein